MIQCSNVPMFQFVFHFIESQEFLVHWSNGPLVHWSIGPLVNWPIGPLVYWSIGPLVQWFIGSLVHWSICPSVQWSLCPLVCWSIGPLVHWSICPMIHWYIGPLVHWLNVKCHMSNVKKSNVNKVNLLSERTSGVPPVIFIMAISYPCHVLWFSAKVQKAKASTNSGCLCTNVILLSCLIYAQAWYLKSTKKLLYSGYEESP